MKNTSEEWRLAMYMVKCFKQQLVLESIAINETLNIGKVKPDTREYRKHKSKRILDASELHKIILRKFILLRVQKQSIRL